MIGAFANAAENACVSIVAEVITTCRSGRRFSRPRRWPMRKSMFSERSCASSTMMIEYARSIGSLWISASRMPSVMNFTSVSRLVSSPKRTLHPTSRPHCTLSSSATRRDTLVAAMRRGCVQPMRPRARVASNRSRHIFGSCVVLPEPVSPATTTTWCCASAERISSRFPETGSSGG